MSAAPLPAEFMGIPIVYDGKSRGIADARGVWPAKKIAVGPGFHLLAPGEQRAVLMHEAAHCLGLHMEIRVALFVAVLLPTLILVPAMVWGPLLASFLLWEFATWVARQQEHESDRFAVQHGCGVELRKFIGRAVAANAPAGDFHPPPSERLERIDKLIREGA